MKYAKYGLLIVAAVALCSCGVGLSKPSASTARKAVEKLTYVKDLRTDQCFAAVSTSAMGDPQDDGMTITWVPCTEKVLAAIKEDQ